MEIFSFLHLSARRLAVIAVVALVAGVVTALVVRDSSDSYEAETVVFAGQAVPSDRSTFSVAPFVSDLEVILSLQPVREEIATASGIDRLDLILSTEQASNGTALSIRGTAENPELADAVVLEAARVGLSTLLTQEADRAWRSVSASEALLLDTQADLERFYGENDTVDPSEEYRVVFDALSSARLELLDPSLSEGDRIDVEDRVSAIKSELGRLAPLRSSFDQLLLALDGAEAAVSQARQELIEVEALQAGAAEGDFLVVTPAEPRSSRGTVVAGVTATVFLVGVFLIGLYALADAQRARSRAKASQLPTRPGARITTDVRPDGTVREERPDVEGDGEVEPDVLAEAAVEEEGEPDVSAEVGIEAEIGSDVDVEAKRGGREPVGATDRGDSRGKRPTKSGSSTKNRTSAQKNRERAQRR